MIEFVAIPPSVSGADISPTRGEIVLFPRDPKCKGRKKSVTNLPPFGGDVPEGQRGVSLRVLGQSGWAALDAH